MWAVLLTPANLPRRKILSFSARKRIGRYEIHSQLGAGGMGEVYLAQDTKLDRKVALKILQIGNNPSTDPLQSVKTPRTTDLVRRFVQEAKAASALNHPNILTIYEIDEIDSEQFIATEFVDGETLRQRIRLGAVTPRDAIDIGIQIAGALNATHSVGIIHRDIKPDNIMLRRDGIVKVLDFGLAKLTRDPQLNTDSLAPTQNLFNTGAGIVLGTAQYMSPEQARGLEVDARTDIWSLGCVLYEMVSGRQPFAGLTTVDVMSGILSREPHALISYLPEGPRELERIVFRALRKDREERYQTIKDLLTELKDSKTEFESRSRSFSSHPGSTELTPEHAVPEKSIAVLYFENMNSEQDSDYFCAGITEDIITDLSKIKELKVVPRSDVLPFRNKEVNIRQVGEALRVNYILDGSVRKAGNKIRITAQLIDVRHGYQHWAERFDRSIEDIFDLQNDVSQRIVDALKISLSDTEKQLLAKNPTENLRAYDLFMRARELQYLKGKRNTESAIQMYEEALVADPNFASAYAGLGEAYSAMYEWYDGNSIWLSKAIEMNLKAQTLDPSSMEAQFGVAMVYFHQQRFTEAKRVIEHILEANSDFYPGYLRLGIIAELSGETDNALKLYQRAAALKPYDEDPWRFLVGVYRRLGDIKAAEEAALKVIEITSRKLEASHEDIIVMSRLAEAYARFGSKEEANATLKRVFELEPNDGLAVYNCACAYALLGEKASALFSLRRAFDNGFRTVGSWAMMDSAFDSMREDAWFQELLVELEGLKSRQ